MKMLNRIKARFSAALSHNDPRTALVKLNVASSLIFKGLSIAISLVSIPLAVSYAGPEAYGVWLTLASIINWMNLADIGLGHGLKNKLITAFAEKRVELYSKYISTAFVIFIAIGIICLTLFQIAAAFFEWSDIVNTKAFSGKELWLVAFIICGSFALQLVLQTYTSTLSALQQTAKLAGIGTAGQLVSTLLLAYVHYRYVTGSLISTTLILTVAPLLFQALAAAYFFVFDRPDLRPKLLKLDFIEGKTLLTLGGAFFFVQIGGLLLFQTDNVVIAHVLGPEEVTTYAVAFKVFSVISLIFTIAMTPLWPAFGDAYAKGDMPWISSVFHRMYKFLYAFIAATAVLVLLSPWIFKIWMPSSLVVPIEVSFCMGIYVVSICWMAIPCYLVNGLGKIRLQIILYLFASAINIPAAVLMARWIGVSGVVVANFVVVFFMGLVLRLQCKKIVEGSASGVWNK